MNKKLVWLFLSTVLCVSGCTFNVGTGTNTANNGPSNTASPSSPAVANTQPATNAAKGPEAANPASKSGDDPRSEEETIQFAKGTRESTLDRTIAPGVSKMYLLNAKKGQHLYFDVTEETKQLDIDFNKRPVKVGEHVQWELTSSGEWAIYVSNPSDKTLKYKLFVGIDD